MQYDDTLYRNFCCGQRFGPVTSDGPLQAATGDKTGPVISVKAAQVSLDIPRCTYLDTYW